jgi:predicted  nucleic acid-binding Zn-ribbon protein
METVAIVKARITEASLLKKKARGTVSRPKLPSAYASIHLVPLWQIMPVEYVKIKLTSWMSGGDGGWGTVDFSASNKSAPTSSSSPVGGTSSKPPRKTHSPKSPTYFSQKLRSFGRALVKSLPAMVAMGALGWFVGGSYTVLDILPYPLPWVSIPVLLEIKLIMTICAGLGALSGIPVAIGLTYIYNKLKAPVGNRIVAFLEARKNARHELANLRVEVNNKERDISKLGARVTELEGELVTARKAKDQAEKDLGDVRRELTEERSSLVRDHLERRAIAAERRVLEIERELEKEKAKLSGDPGALAEAQRKVANLEQAENLAKQKLADAEFKEVAHGLRADHLEKERDKLAKRIREMETKEAELKSTLQGTRLKLQEETETSNTLRLAVPVAPKIIDPVELRDRVRKLDKPLLFTHNLSLGREFRDIVANGRLSPNGRGCLFLRNGLGHEYGKPGDVLTIVVKQSLWESEKDEPGNFRNIFLEKVQGRDVRQTLVGLPKDKEQILVDLRRGVDYSRNLKVTDRMLPSGLDGSLAGMSLICSDLDKYMGVFPQLEIAHDIALDQVETILVPEHLYEAACEIAQENPQVLRLLQKVEGTGENRQEFLEGRKGMPRRPRAHLGRYQPNFGDEAFYRFEQAYFRVVLGESPVTQTLTPASISFVDQVRRLTENLFDINPYSGWLGLSPTAGQPIIREKDSDWKIFVNPRPEEFFGVLEAVCSVLANRGIQFKVPADLNALWRPGRTFSSSSAPKIVIYVNQRILPEIMEELNAILEQRCPEAGFPAGERGPSFCRRYASLLFYKVESFDESGEVRAEIGEEAKQLAIGEGITDRREIKNRQQKALREAGFVGENYYMRKGDLDPLLGSEPRSEEEPEDQALQAERQRAEKAEGRVECLLANLEEVKGQRDAFQKAEANVRKELRDARTKLAAAEKAKHTDDPMALAYANERAEKAKAEVKALKSELETLRKAPVVLDTAPKAPTTPPPPPPASPEQQIQAQLELEARRKALTPTAPPPPPVSLQIRAQFAIINDPGKSGHEAILAGLSAWKIWAECADKGEPRPLELERPLLQRKLIGLLGTADAGDFTEDQRDEIVSFLMAITVPRDQKAQRQSLIEKYKCRTSV